VQPAAAWAYGADSSDRARHPTFVVGSPADWPAGALSCVPRLSASARPAVAPRREMSAVPDPELTHPARCCRHQLRQWRKQAGFPSAAGGEEHRRQPAGRTPRSAPLTRYAARCAQGMPVVPAPRMCGCRKATWRFCIATETWGKPWLPPQSLPFRMVQREDGAIWRSQRCPEQALSLGPGGSPPRPHTCCAAACARMGCASGRSCRRRCARQSGNGGVTGEGALARIHRVVPRRRAAWLPCVPALVSRAAPAAWPPGGVARPARGA